MRLRRLREAQGISIETLAQKAGVSARQLIRVEHGTPSPTVTWVLTIATALDVHPAELFRDASN
jgi:transcriptional regulator with XRE-family HTH domain